MLRPAVVRPVSVALLVIMTVVACRGGAPPLETGISPVHGVAPSTIGQGATIRFVVGTDSRLNVGHLSKLTADSLIVDRCANCDKLRYGTREISRLEVLRGSSRGKHFAVGLGVGALAGVIGAAVNNALPCHTDVCDLRLLGFFYGPAIGALIGGIIGLALPTRQRWEPVVGPR